MSASRSLAAARSRRSGESAPPVSGNRPVTSIGSYAQQMPPQNSNVRLARGNMQPQYPPHPQYQQHPQYKQAPPHHQYYDPAPQNQAPPSNGLPFSKLSISDAIGLITLRLGRVEQWIIESEHETTTKGVEIPENHKMIDNSVLTTMINRIDVLEKKETQAPSQDISKLSEDVKKLTDQLTKIGDDFIKHTIEYAKHHEQLFKMNRELTETKDILKTFMLKYDVFVQETAQNFTDYEVALGNLEQKLPEDPVQEPVPDQPESAPAEETESIQLD